MKVLWFINTPFTGEQIGTHVSGGRGGWLLNLAAIVKNEVELDVAFVHPYMDGKIRSEGITAHAIKPRWWKAHLALRSACNYRSAQEFTVEQLRAIVDKVKPELIHIHGTEKGYIELLRLRKEVGVPMLVSIQGVMQSVARVYLGGFDLDFIRNFWYDHGGRPASLLPKRVIPSWKVSQAQAEREKRCLPFAENIAGRTEYDRMYCEVVAPTARYFHIDRVLRRTFYEHRWHSPGAGGLRIISTQSDALWKGFELLCEAAELIGALCEGMLWRVAGLSEAAMSAKAARKRMGSRYPGRVVQLLGSLDAEVLKDTLCGSHIFVLCSYMETSPNALAEAQSLGLPCIATDVGGVGTYIDHGVTGLLVPPGDPFALAGAILQLSRDPVLSARLGAAGREVAFERHDPRRVKKQILGAYESIVGGD